MAEKEPKDTSLGFRTAEGMIFLLAQVEYFIALSEWTDEVAVEHLRNLRADAHALMKSPLAKRIAGGYQTSAAYLFGEMHKLQDEGMPPEESLFSAAMNVADVLGVEWVTVLFYYHTRGDVVLPGDRRMTRREFDKDGI